MRPTYNGKPVPVWALIVTYWSGVRETLATNSEHGVLQTRLDTIEASQTESDRNTYAVIPHEEN